MNITENATIVIEPQTLIGKSTAVLGITGSGKTNTVAVLIEELLLNNLPLTIVDIEGEYWGLKEKFEILVAGRSEHAELPLDPDQAASLAEISIKRGISVILDMSEYSEEEQYTFLLAYFTKLWEIAGKERKPYHIILEESHEWIPQGASTPLKQMLTRIALRGRKRGLGIILASQRSAKVEKDVLTQATVFFLHRVVHPIDMKVYRDIIPLPGNDVEHIVGNLLPGQAVVIIDHKPVVIPLRFRHTYHAGATPEFGQEVQPDIRKIDASLLQELQKVLVKTPVSSSNIEVRQAKRIKELEALLAERNAELQKARDQIELLTKFSITSPDALHIRTATVQEMRIPHQAQEPRVVEASKSPTAVLALPQTSLPLNEQKFAMFKKRIQDLPALELAELKLLTKHEHGLTHMEIAAWLNRSENTIRNNPPHTLLQLRLVSRSRFPNGFRYVSKLQEQLQIAFPGSDAILLVQRLFERY